jgi:hypothetical protein
LVIFNTLLKRLSDRITESVNVTLTKDDGLKEPEEVTLKGFGKKIGEHLSGRAMADGNVMGLDAILEPKIADVDMTGFGTGRGTAIGCEANSAFIVLFEYITSNSVALRFHEMLDPDCVRHIVTGADRFSFGGAFGVQFLFDRFAEKGAAAKRDGTTSVAAAIGVDSIRRVDPGTEAAKVVGTDSVLIIEGAIDVFKKAAEFAKVLLGGVGDTGGKKAGGQEEIHATT